SLAEPVVSSGGRLHGRVALSNTDTCQYRALRVTLVAVETVPALISTLTQHDRVARWTVPIEDPTEDEPFDFALAMPTGLAPGFRTRSLSLEWFLEVRVDVAWALDLTLWIPLVIRPPRREDRSGEAPAPLAVGSQRLALVWREAAREAGYEYVDGELRGEIGRGRAVVRREHRGRRGLQLVGELVFDPLELGLRADGGQLGCRDPEQQAVLRAHTDALVKRRPVVDADDEHIRCTADDSGTRVEPVAQLAKEIAALGRAFEAAWSQLPAPRDMAPHVPAFRAAARRLGGRLELANMGIHGVRDDIPFSLRTRWSDDGTRARTELEVCPTLPIDGRWHQRWDGADALAPVPPGLQPLLDQARGLCIDAASIRLVFAPGEDDLDPLVARLEGLLMVGRRLGGHGPSYR
ncbi:MAG: hypothetical protein KDK70_33275, partial [Myxococcales bacterium]|nr:hypothetical protein [Myxococcales bacterium]